jgi:hypothetical protein
MRCRFRYGEDLIGNLGVEALKPRKLLRLGLVKPKERQLEGLGERCHAGIIAYLATVCKIAIHPATEVAGFLAGFL